MNKENFDKIYKEVTDNDFFKKNFELLSDDEKIMLTQALNQHIMLLCEKFIPSFSAVTNSYLDSQNQLSTSKKTIKDE